MNIKVHKLQMPRNCVAPVVRQKYAEQVTNAWKKCVGQASITLTAMQDKLSNKTSPTYVPHRWGLHSNIGDVVVIHIAISLVRFLNETYNSADQQISCTYLALISGTRSTAKVDDNQRPDGFVEHERIDIVSMLQHMASTLGDIHSIAFTGTTLDTFKGYVSRIKDTPYFDPVSAREDVLNFLILYTRYMSLAFIDKTTFTITYDFVNMYEHADSIDEIFTVFEQWLSYNAIQPALDFITDMLRVKEGDVEYDRVGVRAQLKPKFFERFCNDGIELINVGIIDLYRYLSDKDEFIRLFKKMALAQKASAQAGLSISHRAEYSLGFLEGEIDTDANQIEMLQRDMSRYTYISENLSKFTDEFFVNQRHMSIKTSGYTYRDQLDKIFNLAFQDPHYRNNCVFEMQIFDKEVADTPFAQERPAWRESLEVSPSDKFIHSTDRIRSFDGQVHNLLSPEVERYYRKKALDYSVVRKDKDSSVYIVKYHKTIRVIVPPDKTYMPVVWFSDNLSDPYTKRVNQSREFITVADVPIEEASILDIYFSISDSENEPSQLESIFFSRLRALGTNVNYGPEFWFPVLTVSEATIHSELFLISQAGALAADVAARKCTINVKLPDTSTRIRRDVEIPRYQNVQFPVSVMDVNHSRMAEWTQSEIFPDGFISYHPRARFAIKKDKFDIIKNTYTGIVKVDIFRDVNFVNHETIKIIDQDVANFDSEDQKLILKYSPYGASDIDTIYAMLDGETLYDYTDNLTGSGALETICIILVSTYFDTTNQIIKSHTLKSRLNGVIEFLRLLNPDGAMTDTPYLRVDVKWSELSDLLKKVVAASDPLSSYIKFFKKTFEDFVQNSERFGYQHEVCIEGDTYKLLYDKYFGNLRRPTPSGFMIGSVQTDIQSLMNVNTYNALVNMILGRRISVAVKNSMLIGGSKSNA